MQRKTGWGSRKLAGISDAYSGQGYAGIYAWMNKSNNYREYLLGTLKTPLIHGSIYNVEFHYRFSSYSRYAIDRIGIALTVIKPVIQYDQVIGNIHFTNMIKVSAD
ncbi:MAG: hypothetical protein ABIS36_24760 [Chryseolinea sp.]